MRVYCTPSNRLYTKQHLPEVVPEVVPEVHILVPEVHVLVPEVHILVPVHTSSEVNI